MFDWDDQNIGHIARHGVSPDEAEQAVMDSRRISRQAYSTGEERRSAVVGATLDGRLLFVVYTRRRGLIRVVTARDAHPDDRRWYRR